MHSALEMQVGDFDWYRVVKTQIMYSATQIMD